MLLPQHANAEASGLVPLLQRGKLGPAGALGLAMISHRLADPDPHKRCLTPYKPLCHGQTFAPPRLQIKHPSAER